MPQSATLASTLSEERHRHFVARRVELEAFSAALVDVRCSLLFVSGPTGVGKTSFLRECKRRARELGHLVRYVQADELARRTPGEALLAGFAVSFASTQARERAHRAVLFIDGYERLNEEGASLLDRLGHELPRNALIVLASRKQPPQRLFLDQAWARLTRQLEIAPWSEQEASVFLNLQGVSSAGPLGALGPASGYPLALALSTQILRKSGGESFGAEQLQLVLDALAGLLSLRAASRTQQLVLDVCALSPYTSARLLGHVLRCNGIDDAAMADELFEWLVARPYVERTEHGAQPHLLARMTLNGGVSNEKKYDTVFRPVREYWVDEIALGQAPAVGLRALFYLDRDLPLARRRSYAPDVRKNLLPAQRSNHAAIIELVRRHEGDAAAELCRLQLSAAPQAFEVAGGDAVDAMLCSLQLTAASHVELADRDPADRLVKQYLLDHPLEKGVSAIFFRWFMADAGYQSPSAQVLSVAARQVQVIMTAPSVAYSLCVYRDPDEWTELLDASLTLPRTVVGRFTLGKHRYSLVAFSYAARSLRDLLIDSRKVPSIPAPLASADGDEAQRSKLKRRAAELARRSRLTARETEILDLLCQGVSSEDISARLQIQPRTVKFHQENVLRKTGAATRVELFRRLI